jgi:hypothetical protein
VKARWLIAISPASALAYWVKAQLGIARSVTGVERYRRAKVPAAVQRPDMAIVLLVHLHLGTGTMQTLMVGRDITGISAFT